MSTGPKTPLDEAREALARVDAACAEYGWTTDDGVSSDHLRTALTEVTRLATLESAPTFADGVRAGLVVALDVVYTATNAADNRLRATGGRSGADVCDELRAVGGDIEAIDPASVKP